MITHEVIKKAQQGDSDAFTRIYNDTIKTAYYVAKRILLDEQAVEDVLQESYIAVYEHLGDYKAGNFQGWVDTIVANRSKNYLRRKNPILFSQMETEDNINIEFEEEKIEFRPDAKIDYDETKRLVMNIVDGLSDEQRLAVILFYFEQRSVKEIAEICECSENTVKSRLNYARKKIKEDVLELEKKGTKLYSISVLPFLYWLFKEEFMACEVPASTSSAVANATGKTIERATGNASSLSNAGAKATETVAKTVVEETVKTGMALGTKIAIGVAVATISVGGIALGSTLLKENTPPTEQSSEKDTKNDTETEQDMEQETEEATELTKEEIDVIVNNFISSYVPEESISAFNMSYTLIDDEYTRNYCYFWCDNQPIIVTHVIYQEVNGQAENINNYLFYYVDKVTGEVKEYNSPSCFENYLCTYDFYVNETELLVGKSTAGGDEPNYYLEKLSENQFIGQEISQQEAQTLMQEETYQAIVWNLMTSIKVAEMDIEAISNFLQSYVPKNTYDVYELKGYPNVTKYYKENIGVRYVSFVAGEKSILAVSIPYGAENSDTNIYYKLELYYYEEATNTFELFANQPDISCDVEDYPTSYDFDVYISEDGVQNGFTLYNGYVFISVKTDGNTLKWEKHNVQNIGGTPLEWKNK